MKSSWTTIGLMALTCGVGMGVGCSEAAPPIPIAEGGSGGAGGEGGGGLGPAVEGVISQSGATRFESDPQLAANGDVIAVVWTGRQDPSQPAMIGYAISLDGGANFSPPATLSADGVSFQSPDVEVDNSGNAYVTFLGHQRGAAGTGAEIYFASSNGTDQFATPEPITDTEVVSFYGPSSITLTNTNSILIAYTESVGNNSELRIARRDSGSSEWTIDVDSGGGQNFANPSLCSAANTPMGRTYLVSNGNGRVALRRTEDNGETWMGIQASLDGDNVSGPASCAAVGTTVFVSYGVRGTGALSEIKVAYSPDAGETIMDVGVVTDPELKSTFALHTVSAQPPDVGHLVYYNGAGPGDDASSVYRVPFTPGILMQEPMMLPDDPPPGIPGQLVHAPVSLQLAESDQRWLGSAVGLDYEGSTLYVAYVDNSGDEAHVAFKAIEP